MSDKCCTQTEKDLVHQWADNWLEFFLLLNEVTGAEKQRYCPPPPTDEDEITYQKLRFWFCENELTFMPLWHRFCGWRKSSGANDLQHLEEIDTKGLAVFMDNPFGHYYAARTLYTWAHHMGLQYSTVVWEPDKKEMQKVRPVMAFLSKMLVEGMVDWAGG